MLENKMVFDVREMPSPFCGHKACINDAKISAILHELDHGCGATIFDGSSLLKLPEAQRDKDFVAFGERLGSLQVRGKAQTPIWRVRPKKDDGVPKSYSEESDVAPFHTDASYYPNPMKYLVFLAIRSARIGGENQVLNLNDRLTESEESILSKEQIEILQSELFPFSMSPTFHDESEYHDLPIELGPVLTESGQVRFQIKALREGFRRRPDLVSDKKNSAVEALNSFLQAHLRGRGTRLASGQLLVLNNWRTLHSRKAFDDPDRLLLRLSVS